MSNYTKKGGIIIAKNKTITLPFYPNKEQKELCWNILGSCFYAANSYISHTKYMHTIGLNRLPYKEFHKYYNKCKNYTYEEINNVEDEWEKDFALELKARSCYKDTKAVKDALKRTALSYKRVYEENKHLKEGEKPHHVHFRNYRNHKRASFYFVKDTSKIEYIDKKHLSMPILGTIKILHLDRIIDIIPYISSGNVIIDHGKWFISFIYKDHYIYHVDHNRFGIGIDYGVSNLITISKCNIKQTKANYYGTFKGFLKDPKYLKMIKRYKSLQRAISHKQEVNYGKLLNDYLDKHGGKEPSNETKKYLKSLSYKSNRINKLYNKAHKQMLHITNYRDDYFKKCAYNIVVDVAPSFIKIEDLKVSKMVSNKNLNHENKDKEYITHKSHKNIEEISPYKFKTYLLNKCNDYNTILMLVDQYYPSTQTCSCCGYIRKDNEKLMKKDRAFICPKCGYEEDRDINASINIALTQEYKIISA